MASLESKLRSMQRKLLTGRDTDEGGGAGGGSGAGDDEWTDDDDENDADGLGSMMVPLLALGGQDGDDDDDDDDDGALEGGSSGGGGGRLPMMPLLLFSQPVSLEDLIDQALTLTHYETFSSIMRKKAKQVKMRREWLSKSDERDVQAKERMAELDAFKRTKKRMRRRQRRIGPRGCP